MNILLIGNGFDLAHGLPTHYDDFLKFGEKCKHIFTYVKEKTKEEYARIDLEDWEIDNSIKKALELAFGGRNIKKQPQGDGSYIMHVHTDNYAINEIYSLIKENAWFEYFCATEKYMGANWIDFESEISTVIKILNEVRDLIYAEESIKDIARGKSEVLVRLIKTSTGSLMAAFRNKSYVDNYILRLEKDLNRLIRALEIYLTEFVGKIEIQSKIKEIEELSIDRVLSFNYTDTYEKQYGQGRRVDYNYIHGVAQKDSNIKANNMVIGIDEYLEGDARDKDIAFIGFKKYYQRILKATSSNYLDWLDIIQEDYETAMLKADHFKGSIGMEHRKAKPSDFACSSTLYVFGHSLDVTDGDILRKLICNDNIRTKIFYYREYEDDKRTLANLIKNLVKVIGMDELVRRTGGETRTIEFLPQSVAEQRE